MLNGIRTTLLTLSFFMPFAVQADAQSAQDFKTLCVNTWMKSAPEGGKVDYQNFGEKYCTCAAGKPLSNQEEVNAAAQLCMGQTLLRSISDRLEDDPGLDGVTPELVSGACQASWTMISSPKTGAPPADMVTRFCGCIQPKLVDLAKKNGDLTDDQWYEQVDVIANGCPLAPAAAAPAAEKPAEAAPAE